MTQTSDAQPTADQLPAGEREHATAMVPFSWPQQIQFTLKELRETLRDRRTIVTLLAMPILLYPLLGLGFRFVAIQQATSESPVYLIATNIDQQDDKWIEQEIGFGQYSMEQAKALRAQREQAQRSVQDGLTDATPSSGSSSRAQDSSTDQTNVSFNFSYLPSKTIEEIKQLVADGTVDLAMIIQFQGQGNGAEKYKGPVSVELVEDRNRLISRNAADWFSERITAANYARFVQVGRSVNSEFNLPVDHHRTTVEQAGGKSTLLGLLPLILLLMTVTGGVYPAIDLTAGERERNTLETLISIPVPKFRLLLAKFVAVFTVTLLTGLVNLTAMSVTLYALQLDKVLLGSAGFSFALAAKLLLALSAFGLLFSAVLLMLTSSARSFKEAQAYLIPLLLLSIGPGLVILLPNWELNRWNAVVPLVNILLLSKQFLEGNAELLPAVAAILSTVLYGVAALGIAAAVFGEDAVAVGSRGKLQDLLHSSKEAHQTPSTTIVLVGLAFLFPAYFVVSGVLSRQDDSSMDYRLIVSAVMTVVLFLLFPILLLRFEKVPTKLGLSLFQSPAVFLIGAILLGCSTWPWIFEIIVGLNGLELQSFDASKIETVQKLLASWKELPLALIVFCLGIVPGVCEEAFFRGFLYNGLKQSLRPWTTIIATALAFGLFHVVLSGGAAPERVLPSTLMGLLLGWVRWRTGSLIPGAVLHATHNSLLLVMASFRDELEGWGLDSVQHEKHLPATWLGIAAIGFILGFALIYFYRRSRPVEGESVAAS